jgi:hypothetical protein
MRFILSSLTRSINKNRHCEEQGDEAIQTAGSPRPAMRAAR